MGIKVETLVWSLFIVPMQFYRVRDNRGEENLLKAGGRNQDSEGRPVLIGWSKRDVPVDTINMSRNESLPGS